MKFLANLFLLIILFLFSCKQAKETSLVSESPRQPLSEKAIAEWRDQKYSMFIHFGLFSLPAGVWKGQQVTKGYSEQIRAHGKITIEEFHELAKSFNPIKWSGDSIALLAKEAGMKSIVITSKHHDGFAMYDTKYSDFNIVKATPFKRDVIKELADACKKHGLKFGVYFSLIDWDFPEAMPISEHNSDSIPPEHHQLNLHQVEELMTNYGPMSEIWFDMGRPTFQQSKELADLVRKYQPDCLVSGRLWNDQGDFAVMGDNASPDFRMGTLWQTPASMFDETWGYRSWQVRGDADKKALEKLTSMIKVVSNGGNYLLNIGPKDEGSVVPFEKEVLLKIGAWLKTNGEAIYATISSPLPEQEWGVITSKPGKLFLFILNQPSNGIIELKGLKSKLTKATYLSEHSKSLNINSSANGSKITINKSNGELIDVVVAEYEGELAFTPDKTIAPSDGSYQLTFENAVKYHSYSGHDYYTTKPTVIKLEWNITNAEGKYKWDFQYPEVVKGKALTITINGRKENVVLHESAKEYQNLQIHPLVKDQLNNITIRLTDQSNPHQDIELKNLIITLKK